jgi:iron(III) transport system substrate-binding protein
MWILNHKAVAGKLYLRMKILRWLSASAYFVLVGAEGLHAGEAKPSSPVEWERTVEAAKKEGKVVVSVPASAELRRGIEKVFKQRFGIDTELNTGSAATIVGKIRQESKSGAPYFDLHMGGGESMITGLLAEGILAPLEPAMMLKEIKDPDNWWGGHIWLENAKRYIYASQAYQVELIWCNTDYAKPEEIRSLADLLNPKWSGKIGYLDPRTPGAGSSMWSFLWKLKGEEYLEEAGGAEAVPQPRSTGIGGKSVQRKRRGGHGPQLLFISSVRQSRTAREIGFHASRRNLCERRQRQRGYDQRSSPSQRG